MICGLAMRHKSPASGGPIRRYRVLPRHLSTTFRHNCGLPAVRAVPPFGTSRRKYQLEPDGMQMVTMWMKRLAPG